MGWKIDSSQAALLVIDVQERLAPVMQNADAVLKRIADAVRVARLFGVPVFHTEQAPEKLGGTVAPVRDALGEGAPPARLRLTFSKANCFAAGELPPVLLITGIETHVCVRQTVFDLRERGHAVYLLADAVSSRSEADHRLALHEMREVAGARITTLEAVSWEMLGRAEGDTFRALLKILK